MNITRKHSGLIWILNKLCEVLPVFFWVFLIFGFDEPLMAVMTIISAIIHECGHIGYIIIKKGLKPSIRGVISGFRIKTGAGLSYDDEIGIYLSGPSANLIAFVLLSLLALPFGKPAALCAIINLATAISNLLPIEGYDGYGALVAAMNRGDVREEAMRRLYLVSCTLIVLLCIISLYFIDRQGEGYWIFIIFFISMIKCISKCVDQ